ncbi:hypothetical protein QR680_002821 [Steinernema hermaphroditum]|uniref:Uncharacterized protein n=1 Tax=Steinernema hermaphroditum TaxID=289476 RepID=A0AA39H4A6_9BILA|nr:hypothetical protein QR680_002821 [Steinernema hermaphroditum]
MAYGPGTDYHATLRAVHSRRRKPLYLGKNYPAICEICKFLDVFSKKKSREKMFNMVKMKTLDIFWISQMPSVR